MASNTTVLTNQRNALRQKLLKASADYWLSFAAAPTFAIMGLLTGILGNSMPDMLCSTAQGASPLTGMVPMYLLMSAFHLSPWLKLFSSRRNNAYRS